MRNTTDEGGTRVEADDSVADIRIIADHGIVADVGRATDEVEHG